REALSHARFGKFSRPSGRDRGASVPARIHSRYRSVPGLDAKRRAVVTESEQLKAQRNEESGKISKLRKEGVDTSGQQQKVRAIGDRIAALDEEVKMLDESFRSMLAGIPNLPHESVPVGRGAEDNVEVRRWGMPREFDFQPKPHWDLGPELKVLDLERAAKVTGARFAVYWNWGAKL